MAYGEDVIMLSTLLLTIIYALYLGAFGGPILLLILRFIIGRVEKLDRHTLLKVVLFPFSIGLFQTFSKPYKFQKLYQTLMIVSTILALYGMLYMIYIHFDLSLI
jgi:hypothetical protein